MIWLLYVVAGLAGLVLLLVVAGACLPARHVASRAMPVSDAEAAWKAITDFEQFPKWRSGLESVERTDKGWREKYKNGWVLPFEIVESHPPRKFVTRIADPSLPFGGTWTYEIADGQLTLTEHGEIRNLIFRTLSRFVFGHHGTIDRYLADLRRRLGP